MNVVLTGFMGSGKTTVGRLIAGRLGWAFVDTDDAIVERHGPIDRIFAERGEDAFRALERDVAAELAQLRGLVIATGGRMLLDDLNADALGRSGRIFCLTADPAEIAQRVRADSDGPVRPLLAGDDPEAAITGLLAERAEGYGRFEQVPTDGRSPAEIAADIIERLGSSAR